jgi:hypothetical protein
MPTPGRSEPWLGYLTYGGSVALRANEPAANDGQCAWYPIEPRGYICVGPDASLTADDAVTRARSMVAPDVTSPWPYQYAKVIGEPPRYRNLPSYQDQVRTEGDIETLIVNIGKARNAATEDDVARIDKRLVGALLGPSGAAAPGDIEAITQGREGQERYSDKAAVAYARVFDADRRTWVLTSDRAVVPANRLRPFARSHFHGVALGGALTLPLAFLKNEPRPRYRRRPDGSFEASNESWSARAPVSLEGEPIESAGRSYQKTGDGGAFADVADLTIIPRATKIPAEVPAGGRRSWIEIATIGGWLAAYDGLTPRYATLISAGRGITWNGRKLSATPQGRYRLKGKYRATTMTSIDDVDAHHAEVMYTQSFVDGYALHGAYWHDVFGQRRSNGCVNAAPIDAKWLFEFTEPWVPDGWHAVRVSDTEAATWVVIHE